MIDIESKIVDVIFNAVKDPSAYPNADVTTGYDETVATFPCVVIEEIDNAPVRNMATDDCVENYTRLAYEISVYTDNIGSAKTEGKAILEIVESLTFSFTAFAM